MRAPTSRRSVAIDRRPVLKLVRMRLVFLAVLIATLAVRALAQSAPPIVVASENMLIYPREQFVMPDVHVGDCSAPITFTITNVGDKPLHLRGEAPVVVSGDDPTLYSVVREPPNTLAPGASATFRMVFAPTDLGQKSVLVTIITNDRDGQSYSFYVIGNGVGSPRSEL